MRVTKIALTLAGVFAVMLSAGSFMAAADHPTQGDDTVHEDAHRQVFDPGVGTGLINSEGASSNGFAQQVVHNPTCGGYDPDDHGP